MFNTYVTLPHTLETVNLTNHNAEQVESELTAAKDELKARLKEAKDELDKVVAEKDKVIETLKQENHGLAEKVEQEEQELKACQVTRTHEDESCRENMRELEKDKEKIVEDLKLDESNSVLVTIYQSGNTVDEELGDGAFIYKFQANDTILKVKRTFDERLLGGQHKENVNSAVSLYARPRAQKQLDDNIQLSTLVTDRRVTLWVRMYAR